MIGKMEIVASALAFLVVSACDDAPTPPRSTNEPSAQLVADVPPGEQGVVDAPGVVESATYRLTLAPIEGAAEAEQALEVSLAGVGDWHVNTEYPIAVTVAAADGLALEKAKLDREDAAELSEERARFVFVARPAGDGAGDDRRVSARVRFAMCIPTSCTFHDETVGLALSRE
jgi:hypothetical protein